MRAALKSGTNVGAWLGVSQVSCLGLLLLMELWGLGAGRAETTRIWPGVC